MSGFVKRNWVLAWLTAMSGAVVLMAFGHTAAQSQVTNFDEINVRRVNIIEGDGKPRLILSSRDRMPNIIYNGKEYLFHNNSSGMVFYNDDGSEAGGMAWDNHDEGQGYEADSALHFDQYDQDNTVRLIYRDQNGVRQAGLSIMDRPNSSLVDVLELYDQVQLAETAAERAALQAELDAIAQSYEKSTAERFFAGKQSGDSVVRLADNQGRPRLVLKVDISGQPSVEFLDEAGRVVHRIPHG
jgi:hypothetical protein